MLDLLSSVGICTGIGLTQSTIPFFKYLFQILKNNQFMNINGKMFVCEHVVFI